MNAFVNLSQALYQYCLYSGSMIPIFMVGNLRHANIPQSELDKFREEWLTYHESLERKLEMDKIEVSITDKGGEGNERNEK